MYILLYINNYLYTNYLYTNYLYTNYLYTNYLYTNYLYKKNNNIYNKNLIIYKNAVTLAIKQSNLNYTQYYYSYKRQIKYSILSNEFYFIRFINIISKPYKINKIIYFLNKYYKFMLIHFNTQFNNFKFYFLFINIIINNLLPINALTVHKINKKKKKNARLKNKYENKISYLVPNKRLNFVYKWLKIDIISSNNYSIQNRIYNIFNKLYFNNINYLLIFKLKNKLHTLLLINFLKKKNK